MGAHLREGVEATAETRIPQGVNIVMAQPEEALRMV